MPLVWDIFHASMNAKDGQLTWCCTTGEYGRGSQLSVLEEEFNEDFFFFFEFKKLEYIWRNRKFWFFFFESNLRSTSPMPLVPRPFLKISFFFFFWKFWKSWIFSWNWNFWLMIFFFEKFRNLEFFQGIENFEFFFFEKFENLEFLKEFEKIWLMIFFFFLKVA